MKLSIYDVIPLSPTLAPKSFDYQFMATLYKKGQGIQNDGDNKRGEKGTPMLPELSPLLKVGSTVNADKVC